MSADSAAKALRTSCFGLPPSGLLLFCPRVIGRAGTELSLLGQLIPWISNKNKTRNNSYRAMSRNLYASRCDSHNWIYSAFWACLQALLHRPYAQQVVICPHVYGPAVTHSSQGATGQGLFQRLSASFGHLTQQGLEGPQGQQVQ